MKNLIIDTASKKIFLTLMVNKNIYTRTYDNSKNNFDKLMILIKEILIENKVKISEITAIYVNRGPGSFAGIRSCFSIVKGFFLVYKINYYCFSFEDFNKIDNIQYKDIPNLCNKFKIKKNLIKPIYLS